MTITVEMIETSHASYGGWTARKDVEERIAQAYEMFPNFFNDPGHIQKVQQVEQIRQFFTCHKAVYVNARFNRGKPFTTIKVDNPKFPNHLSAKEKKELYYKPLEALGIVPRFSPGTNSYLFRVN